MSLIDDTLAEILVCPVDHGDLVQNEPASSLDCRVCGRSYPVVDGIPNMLVSEAGEPDD